MYSYDFRVTGYPFRLYSGKNALDKLPDEVERNRARRAFIVCGRTVSRKTPLIDDLKKLLGDVLVGVFDEMGKDTPLPDVLAARDAARDLLSQLQDMLESLKNAQPMVGQQQGGGHKGDHHPAHPPDVLRLEADEPLVRRCGCRVLRGSRHRTTLGREPGLGRATPP